MSKRIFVAGASGVLGRRVVPALVTAGYEVTANVRNPEAAARAERASTPATIDLFNPDHDRPTRWRARCDRQRGDVDSDGRVGSTQVGLEDQ